MEVRFLSGLVWEEAYGFRVPDVRSMTMGEMLSSSRTTILGSRRGVVSGRTVALRRLLQRRAGGMSSLTAGVFILAMAGSLDGVLRRRR